MSRARVGAYALWQLRDYLKDRGVPTLIGASTHPVARLLYLLPPLHRANEVYLSVSGTPVVGSASPGGIPWALVAWLTGYGVVCYVAGLAVLRHRRLAII